MLNVEVLQARPLRGFYEQGLITKDELISLTEPLGSYLEERGFKRWRIYPSLFGRFPDEIFPPGSIKSSLNQYRVDAELLDTKTISLRDTIDELKRDSIPTRTDEEKRFYQSKLLREPDGSGGFRPISFDQYYNQLCKWAKVFVGNVRPEEADAIISDSIFMALPILLGEQGDFNNARHFNAYFSAVVRNRRASLHKARLNELKALERAAKQTDSNQTMCTLEDVRGVSITGEFMGSLSRRRIDVLELLRKGFRIDQTARILTVPKHAVHHAIAGIRDKYKNPRQLRRSLPDEVLLLKFCSFRTTFFNLFDRYPNSGDMVNGYKKGWIDVHLIVFTRRFGDGSWPKAVQEMEELAEERGFLRLINCALGNQVGVPA